MIKRNGCPERELRAKLRERMANKENRTQAERAREPQRDGTWVSAFIQIQDTGAGGGGGKAINKK